MSMRSLRFLVLAFAAFAVAGLAVAQGEPTVQQIYEMAKSGQIDKARQMTQEVLRSHPNSAKAHFVMAELDASQGRTGAAREALSRAESLAPGLPFARPEAVQALRSRVSATTAGSPGDPRPAAALPAREAPATPSLPWGAILLGAIAVAVVASVIRSRAARRTASVEPAPAGRFGTAATATGWGAQPPNPAMQPGYPPQPGPYGQPPGYGPQAAQPAQPAPSGMGGHLMGGLATGLAVGAGALAAQEIGRRMLGGHGQQGIGAGPESHAAGANSPLANDAGLGSISGASGGGSSLPDDFGVADGGSWDDGGGSLDVGGDNGGGWDS